MFPLPPFKHSANGPGKGLKMLQKPWLPPPTRQTWTAPGFGLEQPQLLVLSESQPVDRIFIHSLSLSLFSLPLLSPPFYLSL